MSELHNVVQQEYLRTGASKKHNELGMREMQARAYEKRNNQYILIKSPPASGKSRAMMFLGLDKLKNQGVKKVIVTVPETSIGRSFRTTNLSDYGFFDDWVVEDKYNLCLIDGYNDTAKTKVFSDFVSQDVNEGGARILICTHSTFRHGFNGFMEAYDDIGKFDDIAIGIDEFHHVSAEDSNVLGSIVDKIMRLTSAHIIAMTGSYFRGDTVPILSPEIENKFERVTYTYYEQLNGYEYLKTLGIGYHFYSGSYFDALMECLDPNLKTIVYIPNVNSSYAELTKYEAINKIIDCIASEIGADVAVDLEYDPNTGIHSLKKPDGSTLKIADLVNDDDSRKDTQRFLAAIKHRDDVDIIIALGMAKEGFDWEYCEHVLTIGHRNSLTEVVQIIGRATRDSEGKEHAQFTNLIATPDASKGSVTKNVNEVLKAISLSLLMEQVLKPKVNFRRRNAPKSERQKGDIILKKKDGSDASDEAVDFLQASKDEIIAELIEDPNTMKQAIAAGDTGESTDLVLELAIEQVVKKKANHLSEDDVHAVVEGVKLVLAANSKGGIYGADDIPDDAEIEGEKQYVKTENGYVDSDLLDDEEKNSLTQEDYVRERDLPRATRVYNPQTKESTQKAESSDAFLKISNKFINTSNLPVNLIDSINPFFDAYEVISKTFDKDLLGTISDSIRSSRSNVTEEEALSMYYKIEEFIEQYQRAPSLKSNDPTEVRLAEIVEWLRNKRAKQGA